MIPSSKLKHTKVISNTPCLNKQIFSSPIMNATVADRALEKAIASEIDKVPFPFLSRMVLCIERHGAASAEE